jgi:hypothetical protein
MKLTVRVPAVQLTTAVRMQLPDPVNWQVPGASTSEQPEGMDALHVTVTGSPSVSVTIASRLNVWQPQ